MALHDLQRSENHVSSAKNCPHPPLKELIFDGRVKGTTPLLLACHFGEFESVKRIVESWGVDVRVAATYYMRLVSYSLIPHAGRFVKIESATPLFVAAFQGHSKIVRYLLERGANVTAKTSDEAQPEYDGLTPLNGAVSEYWTPNHRQPLEKQREERNAIILSLFEFGADPSACPPPAQYQFMFDGFIKGTTPLLRAIHHGEFESVKRIVESWGVDVRTAATYHHLRPYCSESHMVKIESATPLFVAAFQGHSKIVRYLLQKGADVTAKTSDEAEPEYDGLTPLDGAVSEHWTHQDREPLKNTRERGMPSFNLYWNLGLILLLPKNCYG